jgi:hypothetical protein
LPRAVRVVITGRRRVDPLARVAMKRERGAAIILAMLIAALAAAVVATVFADQQRWSRTVEHRRDQVQAQTLRWRACNGRVRSSTTTPGRTSVTSVNRGRVAPAHTARQRRYPRRHCGCAGPTQHQRTRR